MPMQRRSSVDYNVYPSSSQVTPCYSTSRRAFTTTVMRSSCDDNVVGVDGERQHCQLRVKQQPSSEQQRSSSLSPFFRKKHAVELQKRHMEGEEEDPLFLFRGGCGILDDNDDEVQKQQTPSPSSHKQQKTTQETEIQEQQQPRKRIQKLNHHQQEQPKPEGKSFEREDFQVLFTIEIPPSNNHNRGMSTLTLNSSFMDGFVDDELLFQDDNEKIQKEEEYAEGEDSMLRFVRPQTVSTAASSKPDSVPCRPSRKSSVSQLTIGSSDSSNNAAEEQQQQQGDLNQQNKSSSDCNNNNNTKKLVVSQSFGSNIITTCSDSSSRDLVPNRPGRKSSLVDLDASSTVCFETVREGVEECFGTPVSGITSTGATTKPIVKPSSSTKMLSNTRLRRAPLPFPTVANKNDFMFNRTRSNPLFPATGGVSPPAKTAATSCSSSSTQKALSLVNLVSGPHRHRIVRGLPQRESRSSCNSVAMAAAAAAVQKEVSSAPLPRHTDHAPSTPALAHEEKLVRPHTEHTKSSPFVEHTQTAVPPSFHLSKSLCHLLGDSATNPGAKSQSTIDIVPYRPSRLASMVSMGSMSSASSLPTTNGEDDEEIL